MIFRYTPYVGVLILNGIISVLISFLVLRRRNLRGRNALFMLMMAALEVSIASAMEVAAVGLPSKVFWAKLGYLGNQSGPVLFLIFALEYTYQDERLTRRNLLLLWLFPLATMILAATNDFHHWIWTSFTPSPDDPAITIYGHGWWYWLTNLYSYTIVLTGCLVLFLAAIRTPQLYRRQIGLLITAAIVPGIGNLMYLTNMLPVSGLDLAPITFNLAALILALGVTVFGLFDLVPIARDVLIEHLNEGVLVLDGRGRLVDVNPLMQKMFGISPREMLGQSIESILPFWSTLPEQQREATDLQVEVCLSQDPPRYLDMHISPLIDQRKHFLGRLVLFREITQRRQIEEELAHNIEELRIINRISLAVTSGLDMERVLKTLLEQCSLVAPIDIFYVALRDESSSMINIPLYYENGKYQVGPSRDIKEHPGLIGSIIRGRRTVYLHDTIRPVTRPLRRETAEFSKPVMSYVGIPLILRDQVIGVMSIQNYRPDVYAADQIRLLEHISVHAAIAIENARLYAEEQRLAIIDELTGIYNYRGLIELGSREVERARRFKRPLSVLFFDIDDFRKFNNTYSHGTGNLILQTVAQRCRTALRTVDVFARYGGDEFVSLLPETDLDEAQEVARRLYSEIAQIKVKTSYGELGVTISIGVSAFDAEIPDLFKLIDRANHGERQAKEQGLGVVITGD